MRYFWYSSDRSSYFSSLSQILLSLKAMPLGTFLMFLLGKQIDGKTYVKLLVGFEKTSTLILPLTILSFRSKNSNPSSPATCVVNWIFPVLSSLFRYSKNKETEAFYQKLNIQFEILYSNWMFNFWWNIWARIIAGGCNTAIESLSIFVEKGIIWYSQ